MNRRPSTGRHVCELSRGSESHLPRLPPNARLRARFKRRLQKFLLVSAEHPFARFHLRSRASLAFEKRRHGLATHWWLVHPLSQFRSIKIIERLLKYIVILGTVVQ